MQSALGDHGPLGKLLCLRALFAFLASARFPIGKKIAAAPDPEKL